MLGKGRSGRAIAQLAILLAVVLTQPAGAAPGDLDPSFASDGRLDVPAVGPFVARAVAVDAADRIVVAGYLCEESKDATCLADGNTNIRVARFTPDGGLDPEFGENGIVTTPIGSGRSQAFDVLVQPDGHIVAAGVGRTSGRDVFALVRYGPRGGLDPTFGSGGVALLPVGSAYASIGAIEPGPNGTLLVAGQAVDPQQAPRLAIARITPAGALDPAFGSGGVTFGGTSPYGYGLALGVTAAGAPIAAGVAGDSADPASFRFGEVAATPTGELLGADAFRVGAASSFANALTVLPGGDILAAGAATDARGRPAMATVRSGAHPRSRVFALGDGAVANDVFTDPGGGAWLVGQIARGGGYGFGTLRLDAAGARQRVAEVTWGSYPLARATAGALQHSGRVVTAGIGCADGTTAACRGGTPVLLLARELGGNLTVDAPRAVTRAELRKGLRVRVHLARPARLALRLATHGRVLRRVRTARPRGRVTLRLRATAKHGPLRLTVHAGRESVTRRVTLRG